MPKKPAATTPDGDADATRPEDDAGATRPDDDGRRQVTISFPLAESLHFAMKMRAVQERTTIKAVMMKALRLAGFDVPDDELVDRRAGRAGRPRGR